MDEPDWPSSVTRAAVAEVRWRPTATSDAWPAPTGPVRAGAAAGCGTRRAGPICADAAQVRAPAVTRMLCFPASRVPVPTYVPSGHQTSNPSGRADDPARKSEFRDTKDAKPAT